MPSARLKYNRTRKHSRSQLFVVEITVIVVIVAAVAVVAVVTVVVVFVAVVVVVIACGGHHHCQRCRDVDLCREQQAQPKRSQYSIKEPAAIVTASPSFSHNGMLKGAMRFVCSSSPTDVTDKHTIEEKPFG